jgi:hypothetical protein
LVNLDLPPYNSEADHYFDLACAAMSIRPIFDNPTVVTVQALTLLACYYGHGGPKFSLDGAWSTISFASSFSQRVSAILSSNARANRNHQLGLRNYIPRPFVPRLSKA